MISRKDIICEGIYEGVMLWGFCNGDVICVRGVREAGLDINLLCCLHKCAIKNITDITPLSLLRECPAHYISVLPGLTGGCLSAR